MFLEQFFDYLRSERRYSSHTLIAYKNDIRQFEEFIQTYQTDLLNVSHLLVRDWMVELLSQGLTAPSINRKISSLKTLYKFFLREGLITVNPLLKIQSLKVQKRLPVFVDEQKLSKLLDSEAFVADFAGKTSHLILEVLFGTGVRLSELLGIKESDIDFYQKNIKVLGKRNKERLIPISSGLSDQIKTYIDEKKIQNFHNNSDKLFVTKNGADLYPKYVYRTVKSYLELISTYEKRSPHVLRHTFATSLLYGGADINAIKELLGHANLSATQIYTHNSIERIKSIYKQAHPKA